jgi:hypothetical protein
MKEINEARDVPFKKLEQAWLRTGDDPKKQERLIKKHDLKPVISKVRPGEIILGVKLKLQASKQPMTFAGLDADRKLIFVTNNPMKIYYPRKGVKRPEGKEVRSIVDRRMDALIAKSITEELDLDVESFVKAHGVDSILEMSCFEIQKQVRAFIQTQK